MTEHVKCFWQNIGQNIRTLFLFELLYRMLGVLIIFPLARLLFYVSIEWYGQPYITQSMMPSYLFRPSTVLLFIILMIVLAVYLMGEMMVLATLFNYSHHKRTVRLKPLLFHVFNTLRNRQFMTYLKWLFPAIILFFAVEFLHLVGIVSTVTLPLEVSEALHTQWLLRIGFYSFLVVMIYLTAETFFTLHGTLIQKQPWRVVRQETKSLLRKKRLKVIIGLILINFVLNVLIYALYVVFVGLLALLIFITRGQAYVLGVLLTALYTFYLIATGLASLILVPVNYAWLSTQYYQLKKTTPLLIEVPLYHESKTRSFDKIWLKRASTVTVLTIFLLNVTSVFTALTEPESRVSYLKRPEIIAHRGAALIAPENTLSALEAALEMDVDVIEFDVRETHDGVPILMHDTRLGRTTDDAANRFVHDVSFDDMRRLDAGSWFSEDFAEERVPSLAEALALCEGRTRVFLDLKARSPAFNQEVVQLIETYNFVETALVLSFSHTQLKEIKALNPDIQTVLLIATFFGDIEQLVNDPTIDHFAFRRTVLQMHGNFIESIHRADKKVYVWAVDDRQSMQRFIAQDVDGLITKDPLMAREIVSGRFTTTRFNALLESLFSPQR